MQAAALGERRRDFRVMGVVGLCHFFSHFYQLALPPLFVLIHQTEGYSYGSLALLITVFYTTSFSLQVPVGFFVDKFGARPILMAGVALMAGTTILYGLVPGYPALIVLSIFAGAGNSVFHPADYSILNASVSRARLGRAFSIHNFGGFVGYAVAPVLVSGMGALWGWQTAVMVAGFAGLITVLVAIALSTDFRDSSHTLRDTSNSPDLKADIRLLFSAPALLCLVFFALLAGGQMGPQWFTDKAYFLAHNVPVVLGNSYISVFVVGIIIGVLAGGVAADRVRNHLRLTFGSFMLSGVGIILMAMVPPLSIVIYPLFVITGFLFGFGFSARDMVVSGLAPPESSGKVFGFVFSGLDIGAASVPLLYGYMIGVSLPLEIFYLSGALIILAGVSMALAGKSAAARPGAT
jgi:MFS transporter, FSR family, fosmidomycin resistance protein